jgi:hypothetical protein
MKMDKFEPQISKDGIPAKRKAGATVDSCVAGLLNLSVQASIQMGWVKHRVCQVPSSPAKCMGEGED